MMRVMKADYYERHMERVEATTFKYLQNFSRTPNPLCQTADLFRSLRFRMASSLGHGAWRQAPRWGLNCWRSIDRRLPR